MNTSLIQNILLPFFPDEDILHQKWWHRGVVKISMVLTIIFNIAAILLFFDTLSSDLTLAIIGAVAMGLFGFFGANFFYRIFLTIINRDLGANNT